MSISKNSYGVGKGPNYGSDVKAITKQPVPNNNLNDEPLIEKQEEESKDKADKVLYKN